MRPGRCSTGISRSQRIWRVCAAAPSASRQLAFQAEALALLRTRLPCACALIGFVGGPLTLYAYAAAGSHEGFSAGLLPGLTNGIYEGFLDQLLPLLAANMALQVEGGADCVAIFDTAAGTLEPERVCSMQQPGRWRVCCNCFGPAVPARR